MIKKKTSEIIRLKFQKGIQVKFFTVDQKVGKSLKCILTKFELSTSYRFQDVAVQS